MLPFLELLCLWPSCAGIIPSVELNQWVQNCPYRYVGEHLSDYARLGSSSRGCWSNQGIGRLMDLIRKGPGHMRLQHGKSENGSEESETSKSNTEKAAFAGKW